MKQLNTALVASVVFMCTPAQAIELSIYGLGNVSVDSVNDGQDSSVYVASNSSRLGFNGQHELYSNLNVIFQYETGVDLTGQGYNDGNGLALSNGQLFTKGRPSYVGLSGNFGEILAGHMPFLDQWTNDYNLFTDLVGDLGNLWEAQGMPARVDNVIYYKTPDFSGFDVAATFVPEEDVPDSELYLIKGHYGNKGLNLALSYASRGQYDMNRNNYKNHYLVAATASYHFDRFSVGGGYQGEWDIRNSNVGVMPVMYTDRNSYYVAGSVDIGQYGKINAQYVVSNGEGRNADASQIAVGYDYQFDTNTMLYLVYAYMDNDANEMFSVNGKGHGDKVIPMMGYDPYAVSLGIIYQFSYALVK